MPLVSTVTMPVAPTGGKPFKGAGGYFSGCGRGLDWRGWARTIVAIRETPRQVALGVALGSFIAFTPFIGLQMLLAALVATVAGASRKAAMLAVWISNPLTMGPIFALTYQLGVVLVMPGSASAATKTVGAGLTLVGLFDSGWALLLPLLAGGALVGLVAAGVSYVLTHRGVRTYQAGKRG